MILGPAGLEHRNDIWIGASLLAPFVRTPTTRTRPRKLIWSCQKETFGKATLTGSRRESAAVSTIRRGSSTQCGRAPSRSLPFGLSG
jgi:hypothetical protein